MKSEQSIPELEQSFHYHVLIDNASPFPEEREEEKTQKEENYHTFYLFENPNSSCCWYSFIGIGIGILSAISIVFLCILV